MSPSVQVFGLVGPVWRCLFIGVERTLRFRECIVFTQPGPRTDVTGPFVVPRALAVKRRPCFVEVGLNFPV
jgi:hypothetical protein